MLFRPMTEQDLPLVAAWLAQDHVQEWWRDPTSPAAVDVPTVAEVVRRAHEWFEHHSGWAPPDPDTLEEWSADGVCRAPDECLVTPEGWCEHGLASWALILQELG